MFHFQESIREIEETLNQQLFNIGMNLNLGSNHSRHSNSVNTNDFDHIKEHSQPVLNVIYENNNSSNSNSNVESSEGHVFSSQIGSFEMDHVALQVR